MDKNTPDVIVAWEKDGNRKWCDINNELFQLIVSSVTGGLHAPKYTIYKRYQPDKESEENE